MKFVRIIQVEKVQFMAVHFEPFIIKVEKVQKCLRNNILKTKFKRFQMRHMLHRQADK